MEYLNSAWEWLQNQQVMDQLRERTTPVVSSEDLSRINKERLERPAPAAGRSGSISQGTRIASRGRSAQIDKENKAKERAKKSARYRLAGEGIKAAFTPEEPTPAPEGTITQPIGIPETLPQLGRSDLPTIQALISGKPSVMSRLFGGY